MTAIKFSVVGDKVSYQGPDGRLFAHLFKAQTRTSLDHAGLLKVVPVGSPCGVISGVYSNKPGEGTRMMKAILDFFDKRGVICVELTVWPQDRKTSFHRLVKFYERFGFQRPSKSGDQKDWMFRLRGGRQLDLKTLVK